MRYTSKELPKSLLCYLECHFPIFFQIYTANMIVLESQTLNRMLETFGVLPTEMSELINTPAEGKITK